MAFKSSVKHPSSTKKYMKQVGSNYYKNADMHNTGHYKAITISMRTVL